MTREEAIKELTELLPEEFLSEYTDAIKMAIKALEAESRMKYVQETVNTIMNACDTDSIADKAMRNAAKFVQNAIDGSYPDFEKLEQEPCEDAISRQAVLDALDKSKYSNEFCEEHHIDWSINLGMAHIVVNELKSVAPQPCGDCISREAVLKAIDAKAWEFCDYLISNGRNDEQKPVSHFADNLRECVGDLPSVTPQPKMGRWIKDKCSICGEERAWYGQNPPYCPDCGCKMQGVEE